MDQSEALHTVAVDKIAVDKIAVDKIAAVGRVPLDALGTAADWSGREAR
jgi:hypothetical protein